MKETVEGPPYGLCVVHCWGAQEWERWMRSERANFGRQCFWDVEDHRLDDGSDGRTDDEQCPDVLFT